jgi:hypothetical protein
LALRWYRQAPGGSKLPLVSTENASLIQYVPITQGILEATELTLSNIAQLPTDSTVAYSTVIAELVWQKEINTSDYEDIKLFDSDEVVVDSEFASIESYVTYYTAQPNDVGRPRDKKPYLLPGYKENDDGTIDFIPPLEGTDVQAYWHQDANATGWDKHNLNLWAVERLDVEGEDSHWTLPNIISVHPGPQYALHLTNDNAFVIAEADGSTNEKDFGDNTTIQV